MKKFFIITNMQYPIIGFLFLVAVASCSKSANLPDALAIPDSQVSFYNASEYLRTVLQGNNGRSQILIDSVNMTYRGDSMSYRPGFSSLGYMYQFPNELYNSNQAQPWIKYIRLYPGTHTISLTDTSGNYSLVATWAKLRTDAPTSVYFADSVGYFKSWIMADTVTRNDSAIHLRLLDLSPDAGKVFFTINGKKAAGIPDSLQYGKTTGFLPLPLPAPGRLLIKCYALGDSTTILASSFLNAAPGHAYNILLKGYKGNRWMRDPSNGKFVTFTPGLNISITQNF